MAYQYPGDGSLNYYPCRYGNSKILFRGPKANLSKDYVAFLGSTETYGKYVPQPFPELFSGSMGVEAVNLGCVNSGVDVFAADEAIMEICSAAKATVVQVSGAQNMSNRFYTVHPRRNDRFLRASTLLQTIYREVDFTEFNFTRHLLNTLHTVSPEKFGMVRQELKDAWVARLRMLVQKIRGPVVLLWIADHSPDDDEAVADLCADPLFVDRQMIEEIRECVIGVIEIVATREDIAAGRDLLVYPDLEAPAAHDVIGPNIHAKAASKLESVLASHL
ncbi:DUF6473 family protein [Celeribacter arenosi]|uniref:DUF6473 family protein n=1 Tax=Celeribacter arenosi TaxID=792649 RepID=A0ABP7K1Y1_9RHOB